MDINPPPSDWTSFPQGSAQESPRAQAIDIIKVESTQDSPLAALDAPSSPSTSSRSAPDHVSSATASASRLPRQRSNTSVVSPRRLRPYPSTSRLNTPDSSDMTAVPAYHHNTWSSSTPIMKSRAGYEEESSSYFAFTDPLSPPHGYHHSVNHRNAKYGEGMEQRPPSSSSSLTGAMGDPTSHFAHHHPSQRPSPPRKGTSYSMGYAPEWQGMDQSQSSTPYIHPQYSIHDPTMDSNNTENSPHLIQMTSSYSSPYSNPSSGSMSSPSPPFSAPGFGQDERATYQPSGFRSAVSPGDMDGDVRTLRKRVRELEQLNEQAIAQIKSLQSQIADKNYSGVSQTTPQNLSTGYTAPPPLSSSMQASWKARTAARVRIFCSLNRAGNALCAWHDSRRERRAHPPRMAPPGYLNCGCTFEEALFEESLARHNVGSYHPGESVRMDPALRNPLLKLLQTRYGYRDGDFERDPQTGDWVDGEGPFLWEQRVQSGMGSARRAQRGEPNSDRGR